MSSILQRVHKALKHRIAHNEPWALLHTCAVEIEQRDTLITELVGALERLVAAGEAAGMCDDLVAEMFPGTTNRSGIPLTEITRNSRRCMNEARAALTKAKDQTNDR